MSDTVLVALISGGMTLAGTIITVIVTAIGNRKALAGKIDNVEKQLKQHADKNDSDNAIVLRARILRFRNDLRASDSNFDEDYWDSILKDITDYKKYCTDHPDFPNEKCVHAISYIERKYDELLYSNGFAKDD